MIRRFSTYTLVTLFIGLALVAGQACREKPDQNRIDIAQALSDQTDADCFQTVLGPRPIVFPEDSGPHPGFRTEWWYYTGNLTTKNNRHFGFQLTFFRQAISCEPVSGASKWRTRQLYFAHFAVTDTQTGRFHAAHRMNRQSIGIAGAAADPFRVWIDDWQAVENGSTVKLTASESSFSLDLALTPVRPVVRQGEQGFSRKGRAVSNASYYYSLPRMTARGAIHINDERFDVAGNAWFDHEWSTSALEADVAGWDWFSVHLEDGRDLMVCQIRTADNRPNGYGFGSISFPDGRYLILSEKQFSLKVLGRWKSSTTSKTYPARWQVTIPGQGLDLTVTPVVPNQEHTHVFAYWEGAAAFEGDSAKGMGYIEMTGY